MLPIPADVSVELSAILTELQTEVADLKAKVDAYEGKKDDKAAVDAATTDAPAA